MAKINCDIHFEQTKTTITARDIEDVWKWIQANIMDKLPESASATFSIHITS